MLEVEILAFVGSLEGVAVLTASEEGGAPEVAWGDSFFYYVPPGEEPNYQQQPVATLVCSDYPGFDVESQLDQGSSGSTRRWVATATGICSGT